MVRLRHALPAFVALYATMYAAFGVASPFWPRFFEARGLSPEQLGVLLALGMTVRWVLAGPLAGRLADQLGASRGMLAACAACAALVGLALLTAHGFWFLLLLHMAHAAALAPTTTLADALALNAAKPNARQRGFEYGWVRGAASAAFIAGTLTAGQVLMSADLVAIVWMQALLLAIVVAAVRGVPALDARTGEERLDAQAMWSGVRELIGLPLFRRLLLIVALVYGSHAMLDGFAVIRWSAAGIPPGAASLLWSAAVASEVIVFLLIGPALIQRLGTNGAAVLAAGAGILRWVVMAQTTDVVALALVQPLHGLTFALLHLACMRVISEVVPVRLAATAQALYATASGIATALLMVASGYLYATWDGHAFLAMALLCAAAVPAARRFKVGTGRDRQVA
jgi:PPP family 3-phenylpropionic acid transporter